MKTTLLRKLQIAVLLLMVCITLQACKLGVRQKAQIPYLAVAITGSPSQFLLGQLQFDILTYIDIKVAISPADADLILEIVQDVPNSQIASYSGAGQISAYDINDVVVFRVYDKLGNELIPQTEIFGVRDMNFSVSNALSADIQQQQFIADIRKELALKTTIRLMSLGHQRR